MKRQALLLLLFVVILRVPDAVAHHSFAAEFDGEKPVTLKGAVVKWEMMKFWLSVHSNEIRAASPFCTSSTHSPMSHSRPLRCS